MEACRLCEASPDSCDFKHIFDKRQVNHDNLAEIILVMTGVQVEPTDPVSQKVCSRCCNIVQKMYKYRQDAQKQDKALKEKYAQLSTKGIKLPNTNVTIKRDQSRRGSSSRSSAASTSKDTSKDKVRKEKSTEATVKSSQHKSKNSISKKEKGPSKIDPSIDDIFRSNPTLKLPKRSFPMSLSPTVSLKMGEVETYFKKKRLDIKSYTWQSQGMTKTARKKTTQSSELLNAKTVAPLKISKKVLEKHDANLVATRRNSNSDSTKERKRKRSSSVTSTSTNISFVSTSEHSSEISKLREIRETTPVQSISNKAESSTPGTPGSLLMVSSETKSQPIFVCDLCGSVHNSNGMLRIHLAKRHMVCQFCKRRFKTLEAKNEHIQNDCHVKEIIDSNGPTVKLEKVDKILKIRRKFQSAFNGWDSIPGLEETKSVEEIVLPEPTVAVVCEPVRSDGVIEILSDDDEPTNDTLLTENTKATIVNLQVVDTKLKPDVRIKNNSVLNNITQNASDVQVIKELLGIVLPKSKFSEMDTQTDFPENHEIKINLTDGNAELKNLKEHLKVFKVPLTIRNGNFKVSYQLRKEYPASAFHYWTNLPVRDIPPQQVNKLVCKDYFTSHATTSPTLEQLNRRIQQVSLRNSPSSSPSPILKQPNEIVQQGPIRNRASGLVTAPNALTSMPPQSSKIILSVGNVRQNQYPVVVNPTITPQLSIPKPSVNYNPSRMAISPNNIPVILNHQMSNFSGSTAPAVTNLSKSSTVVNPAASHGNTTSVMNPAAVSNTVLNPLSTVHPPPMIRVRSVKELQ